MFVDLLVPREEIIGSFKRPLFYLALVLSTVAFSFLGVYIHPLSITVSFESIPLVLSGIFFGPLLGAVNGLAADLISFPWGGNHEYSFMFMLQPVSIGFFGGLFKCFSNLKLNQARVFLGSISVFFTLLYGYLFSSMIWLLVVYLVSFLLFLWLSKKDEECKKISLAIVFCFLIYISSFGIGVVGSMFLNKGVSPLLFFKVRAYKELVKLFVFLPVIYLCLSRKSFYEQV